MVKGKPYEGPTSIYAVITKSRTERFRITTDEKVSLKDWDKLRQEVRPNAADADLINPYLYNFKSNVFTMYRENREKLTFHELKNLARGVAVTDEKKTLRSAFDAHIAQWEAEKDEKTVLRLLALKAHFFGDDQRQRPVVGYTATHGEIDFADIDWNFHDKFKSFLYSKGMVDSTVFRYMTSVQTFLRWARKRGYPVNNSFDEWVIPRVNPEPIALTLEELNAFYKADLTGLYAIARDIFCLEAFTGQRISDLKRIRRKDVTYDPIPTWTFQMKKGERLYHKTQTVYLVGYSSPALEIFERYNFTFPEISEGTINTYLKLAANIAGLNRIVDKVKPVRGKRIVHRMHLWEVMTTHTGRRTLLSIGAASLTDRQLMDLSGLSDSRILKHYVIKKVDPTPLIAALERMGGQKHGEAKMKVG